MGFGGVGLGLPAWVWVCRRGYGGFRWLPWDSVAWVWVRRHGLLEEGGTIVTLEGDRRKCSLTIVLKVLNPQFYWKVMTRADLGLADAYIDGDISFTDKNEGLLNLFMILIASRDSKSSISKLNKNRGWWTPLMFTACIGSAKYFLKHISRQNTLTQARRNISRHYELV
uniref:Uncharacterized protein n=1 Tax=Fagus sylvatica TaxID=28930 RepID=A0A2N9GKQ2_FAGSY